MSLRIGVLAVQGAVSEHTAALERAAANLDVDVEVIAVRTLAELDSVTGLVMPGGESTTMSRLLRSTNMQTSLQSRARAGELAVFGTCAGMILLASRAHHDVANKDIELLDLLDATVDRNAFGRQRDSFEAVVDVDGIGPMPAVFIRAPSFEEVGSDVEVLARCQDRIVAARAGNVLAAAFHPELTPDTRLHEMFISMANAPSSN
jgi:pyridoxal 5'-phosphate synthase pdxT subunit